MKLYDWTNNKSNAKGTWNEDQYQTVKGRDWLGKYTVVERVVSGGGQQFMPEAIKKLQTRSFPPSIDLPASGKVDEERTGELSLDKKKKNKPNA